METVIKFKTFLKDLPEDDKGLDVIDSGKSDTPYVVVTSKSVDVDAYIDMRDERELATRSAIIDIQKDGRNAIKVKLGVASKRETADAVKARQLEDLATLYDGRDKDEQYETMKKIILGN